MGGEGKLRGLVIGPGDTTSVLELYDANSNLVSWDRMLGGLPTVTIAKIGDKSNSVVLEIQPSRFVDEYEQGREMDISRYPRLQIDNVKSHKIQVPRRYSSPSFIQLGMQMDAAKNDDGLDPSDNEDDLPSTPTAKVREDLTEIESAEVRRIQNRFLRSVDVNLAPATPPRTSTETRYRQFLGDLTADN